MDQHHLEDADTLDLRDYLAVLSRRKWIVVQTVVLVLAVAIGVTFVQTPRYESEVRLVVEPNTGGDDAAALNQLVFGQRELETQKELVSSEMVAERVREQLGLQIETDDLLRDVDVSLLRDTQIIEIRAESEDPEMAAQVAQGFAEAYLAFRQDQALEQLLRSSEALQSREAETRRRLAELETEIARQDPSEQPNELTVERDRLQSELAGIAAQQAGLRGTEVFARGGGQVIAPAEAPDEPFAPKPLRTGVLALVLGAMLGVGLAFLRDFLDDAIRSEDQAVQAAGHGVLGYIPRWAHGPDGDERPVTLVEPASPVAEAYRTLRTNIRFVSVGRSSRSLLVTSALPAEGKTTTAANVAVALARAGTRVLLVGADLRRPAVHRTFGITAEPGLSDVLVGDVELADVISDVGVPNLRVIPSGAVPPNPAELLSSPAMGRLVSELEQIADVVVYDGPPVLAVADALELAPKVGGTLLVIDMGSSGRNVVRQAASRLRGVGVDMSGIVLNNLDPNDGYYGYAYYHAYAQDDAQRKPRSRRGSTVS